MSDKNKAMKKIILFAVIFFIIGGVVGYFIGEHSSKANFKGGNVNFMNGNFQINDSVKVEITSFFDNSPNIEEISTYCQNNPRYCMEYCRIINPSDGVCTELNIGFDKGMPAK